MNLSLCLATYGTVLVTELIGDKTLYTISTLATRYRSFPLFCGVVTAFMTKMLAAVLLGRAIAELPSGLIAGISAATFFAMALFLWLKATGGETVEPEPSRRWPHAMLIGFAAIFFAEWGDAGQITAAALAARYQAPVTVWLGATLAMVTKGSMAMTLGMGVRKRIPRSALRYGAVGLCIVMGMMSALRLAL